MLEKLIDNATALKEKLNQDNMVRGVAIQQRIEQDVEQKKSWLSKLYDEANNLNLPSLADLLNTKSGNPLMDDRGGISAITGKPEPTFEEKNKLANLIGQQFKQQTPEQFLARPPGVYPMENTPPGWIDKDNPDYEKAGSLYGQNPRQVDVMGSGIMESVGNAGKVVKTLPKLVSKWKKENVILDVGEHGSTISLNRIIVPKEARKGGVGSKAMEELTDLADQTGKRLELTPTTEYGATSKNRLEKFYKRFGFVKNSGRNKDFATKQTMFREPAGKSGLDNIRGKVVEFMDEPLEVRESFGGKAGRWFQKGEVNFEGKKIYNERLKSVNSQLKKAKHEGDLTRFGKLTKQKKKLLDKGAKQTVWESFSPETQAYMKKQASLTSSGKTPIHVNSKTGMSVDFSTECAKRRGGIGACPYCYVDHSRHANDLRKAGMDDLMRQGYSKSEAQKLVSHKGSWMPGKLKVEHPYNGELMDMPDEVIRELNKDGGIRMFSFGDFRPGIDEKNVERFLADAQKRGLKVKTITKELSYIEKYADHPSQSMVNLSLDYLPREMSNAVDYDRALSAVKDKPNVGIRMVVLNEKQALKALYDSNVEVMTLYHGYTGKELWEIIKVQNPDLIKRAGVKAIKKEINTWQDLAGPKHKDFRKMLQKKAPTRVCCQGGNCAKDPTKCGLGQYEFAALIPGVHLPEKTYEEQKKK